MTIIALHGNFAANFYCVIVKSGVILLAAGARSAQICGGGSFIPATANLL